MGVNNPNLPSNVSSDEGAIQYLAAVVAAMRNGLYTSITAANPTLTAAQMVGGVVAVSGQTGAQNVTTDTAANIIARMQALDANAAIGSSAVFTLVNDNTSSGAVTVVLGSGVTNAGAAGILALAIGTAMRYLIKWSGVNAVTISRG
jgi:hypothetical protein